MRNPFSVTDVPDPTGPDVEAFAKRLPPLDLAGDENAMAWVAIATDAEGVEGAWSSRWRSGEGAWKQGVATIQLQGDRVFILYKDAGSYLFEGIRHGDKIVGRFINIANPADTAPWVGVLVNMSRIDGYWSGGRWDFRRCSPDERPEPIVAAVLTEARKLSPAGLRELLGFARYLRWRVDGE
ncbi:MAG: hypothetical protein H6Q90_4788 [Deltaproteobacteria bacterium]|nr:hypothetical protein [Deltaproteobacteria bacterium]